VGFVEKEYFLIITLKRYSYVRELYVRINMRIWVTWLYDVHAYVADDIQFADTPVQERHLVGSSVLLQCVVSGLPKPEVSWRFNRQRIDTGTFIASRFLCRSW